MLSIYVQVIHITVHAEEEERSNRFWHEISIGSKKACESVN